MRKKIIFSFLFLLSICEVTDAKKLVILYTNDIMGHLEGEPALFINRDFPPPLGNASSCATYIKRERDTAQRKGYRIILLDAGNCFGNPQQGELKIDETVQYMNDVRYDASAVGIYDTRLGEEKLETILEESSFPWLSANLISRKQGNYIGKLYSIIDYDNIKIGIFGLTPEYGPIWVESNIARQFYYEKELPRAKAVVSLLEKNGCNIIVGLTNVGFVHDSLIAETIPGIDVIIGGGEGRGLRKPFEGPENHTIICRTYGKLSSIGRLELNIDDKTRKIIGYKGDNITLFAEQFPPDSIIQKIIKE